jgi:hypothetical protein
MSDLSRFLKVNKQVKENVFFPATKTLCGEDGEPLQWEIRRVPTKEDEIIRDACVMEIPVPGKPTLFRNKIRTNEYLAKVIVASVVFPDLLDATLQDSYGVKKPEDLVREMIDDAGEYAKFAAFIQQLNGFNVSMNEDIKEAKN